MHLDEPIREQKCIFGCECIGDEQVYIFACKWALVCVCVPIRVYVRMRYGFMLVQGRCIHVGDSPLCDQDYGPIVWSTVQPGREAMATGATSHIVSTVRKQSI